MTGWFTMRDIANIGAKVGGLTQNLGEGAARIRQEIQQKVDSLATLELEDISKAIQNAEENIVAAEAKIKQEDDGLKQAAVQILPWETRTGDTSIVNHSLMEKVLALSLDESNFTTAPCQNTRNTEVDGNASEGEKNGGTPRYTAYCDTPAAFQLERHVNVAVKMLLLDGNLAKIHARLIATMAEKEFWFHYFSRVAALREDLGIEPLCEALPQATSGISSEEYDKINHEDAQSVASPAGVSHQRDPNSDQDCNVSDFSDIGDLDDLDDDGDSNISPCLEAEIAAEIGDV